MSGDRQPAARAVDIAADEIDGDDAEHGYREQPERQTPHAARGKQRYGQHDHDAEGREEQVPLDEVVGGQALAQRHGGACGQRQHEPGADQRQDGADEHVVDGEPPIGNAAAVGAR
jgi:hypothetical protein